MDETLMGTMETRAIGMLAGAVIAAIALALRIARDPMARLGLWSLLTRWHRPG